MSNLKYKELIRQNLFFLVFISAVYLLNQNKTMRELYSTLSQSDLKQLPQLAPAKWHHQGSRTSNIEPKNASVTIDLMKKLDRTYNLNIAADEIFTASTSTNFSRTENFNWILKNFFS